MKTLRSFTIVLAFMALFVVSADAQRTNRRPARNNVKKPAPNVRAIPPLEVRAARVKVANQLSNMNLFIDKLGPIAQNIENLDNDARTQRISQQSIDLNNTNKTKVVQAIRNFRTALVTLEAEFRSKNELKRYLSSIQGISDLAGRAEDSALAGRFVAAKEPLRSISVRLTATLTAMPNVEL